MTQTSYFWDGLVTGDASLAPYDVAEFHERVWKIIFSNNDNQGVISNFENELKLSGISIAVNVASGAALVDGAFYQNTEEKSFSVPTPTTNPRIDRIVLRKDFVSQEIRLLRVEGTESATPVAPILGQTSESIWEVPLARLSVATDGTFDIFDDRDFCLTPLAGIGGFEKIGTLISDGDENELLFELRQPFSHVFAVIYGRANEFGTVPIVGVSMQFNQQTSGYNFQDIEAFNDGTVQAVVNAADDEVNFANLADSLSPAGHVGSAYSWLLNFSGVTLFKPIINVNGVYASNVSLEPSLIDATAAVFLDASLTELSADPLQAIRNFLVSVTTATFTKGTQIDFYGLR